MIFGGAVITFEIKNQLYPMPARVDVKHFHGKYTHVAATFDGLNVYIFYYFYHFHLKI